MKNIKRIKYTATNTLKLNSIIVLGIIFYITGCGGGSSSGTSTSSSSGSSSSGGSCTATGTATSTYTISWDWAAQGGETVSNYRIYYGTTTPLTKGNALGYQDTNNTTTSIQFDPGSYNIPACTQVYMRAAAIGSKPESALSNEASIQIR